MKGQVLNTITPVENHPITNDGLRVGKKEAHVKSDFTSFKHGILIRMHFIVLCRSGYYLFHTSLRLYFLILLLQLVE